MKICYLADAKSEHTQMWCKYFSEKGNEVHVISLRSGEIDNTKVHSLEVDEKIAKESNSSGKLSYLKNIMRIKSMVKEINPDILHAHYGSSYGLLGALCNYHPYIISLWGSDVLLFPKEGVIQKNILKYNLRKADYIFSTSKYMAEEASLYTGKHIDITHFGVDMNLFNNKNVRDNESFKIVIAKSLESIYGLDILIETFKLFIEKYEDNKIQLIIAGNGTKELEYKKLVSTLSIEKQVQFLGKISLEEVAELYNMGNVAIIPSNSESFGVTAIEAQACGIPIIVTDIPAFKETSLINETSLVFKKGDKVSLLENIEKLYLDKELRIKMGRKAEIFAKSNFEVNDTYGYIEGLYNNINKK